MGGSQACTRDGSARRSRAGPGGPVPMGRRQGHASRCAARRRGTSSQPDRALCTASWLRPIRLPRPAGGTRSRTRRRPRVPTRRSPRAADPTLHGPASRRDPPQHAAIRICTEDTAPPAPVRAGAAATATAPHRVPRGAGAGVRASRGQHPWCHAGRHVGGARRLPRRHVRPRARDPRTHARGVTPVAASACTRIPALVGCVGCADLPHGAAGRPARRRFTPRGYRRPAAEQSSHTAAKFSRVAPQKYDGYASGHAR